MSSKHSEAFPLELCSVWGSKAPSGDSELPGMKLGVLICNFLSFISFVGSCHSYSNQYALISMLVASPGNSWSIHKASEHQSKKESEELAGGKDGHLKEPEKGQPSLLMMCGKGSIRETRLK